MPANLPVKKVLYNGREIDVEYKRTVLTELTPLTTGMTKVTVMGPGVPVANLRDWITGGKNYLPQQRGQTLAISIGLRGPAGITFDPQTAAGDNSDIADAAQQVLNFARLRTFLNGEENRLDPLNDLIPDFPTRYAGATPFQPALWGPRMGAIGMREAQKYGVYFYSPPMIVDEFTELYHDLDFNTVPIPAALNTFTLVTKALVDVFPSLQTQQNIPTRA